jgi:hypothetical protein
MEGNISKAPTSSMLAEYARTAITPDRFTTRTTTQCEGPHR